MGQLDERALSSVPHGVRNIQGERAISRRVSRRTATRVNPREVRGNSIVRDNCRVGKQRWTFVRRDAFAGLQRQDTAYLAMPNAAKIANWRGVKSTPVKWTPKGEVLIRCLMVFSTTAVIEPGTGMLLTRMVPVRT